MPASRPRTAVAAVTGALLLLSPLAAPGASAAPGARASDDSCPAGAVPEDAFTDVRADNAHEAPVDCLVWWGISRGVWPGRYLPYVGIPRDAMATFVANVIDATGAELPPATRDHFSDDDDSVHEDNVNRLAEAGVVKGTAPGTFFPNLVLHRDQTASYLVQAYALVAEQAGEPALPAGPDAFADDDESVHEGNIDAAAAAGIAAGTAAGSFDPVGEMRRDQMASFVTRLLDLLVEDGLASTPAPRAGDLDPSYGDQGVVRVELGDGFDEGRATALDAQGRLVVGGESSVTVDTGGHVQQVRVPTLTRLLPDGAPDPGFGGDGTVAGDPGDAFRVLSVAVQADGKVLAGGFAICGRMCTASVLARFLPDGAPDTAFGDGGRVTLTSDGDGPISALAVDPDGRILAGGQTRPTGSGDLDDFAVTRYLPDGSLDESFGEDGRVRTDFRGGQDVVSALVLQPDGAVVAGGTSHASDPGNPPSAARFALARYLDDGSLDPGFGSGGTVETDVDSGPDSTEALTSLALAPGGGVVAAGHSAYDGWTPWPAVVRYAGDGGLDPAFGDDGIAQDRSGTLLMQASGVAVQPDGAVVVGGRAVTMLSGVDTEWAFGLLRLTGEGALDPTFGVEGVVRTTVGEAAAAMELLPDGRIVLAGCSCPDPQTGDGGVETASALVVARYLGDGRTAG